MDLYREIEEAAEAIRQRCGIAPRVGAILGSGLGDYALSLSEAEAIPYTEIPGFHSSGVAGHAGRLVLGKAAGTPVAVLQGRIHCYEGHDAVRVTFPVRVLKALGAQALLVTNAAGGIRRDLNPGDLMLITDHINLMGVNPLRGANDDRLGPRFPDMSQAYHPDLRRALRLAAGRCDIHLKEGVYAAVAGPSYETPAEIGMLATLDADAVGMSTVLEVIVAVHAGLKVCGLSCITNKAAGLGEALSHEEVTEVGSRIREPFTRLLSVALPEMVEGES